MTIANQFAPTWNSSGVNFSAIRANVTDIASSGGSTLLDLQVNNQSKFSVNKTGAVTFAGSSLQGLLDGKLNLTGGTLTGALSFSGAAGARLEMSGQQYTPSNVAINMPWGTGSLQGIYGSNGLVGFASASTSYFEVNTSGLRLASNRSIAMGGTIASPEVFIISGGSNVLEQRNSTNAQTLRLYGTYTDASNYRRLYISSTTAGAFTLGVEGAGTGASGNTLTIASTTSFSGQILAALGDRLTPSIKNSGLGPGNGIAFTMSQMQFIDNNSVIAYFGQNGAGQFVVSTPTTISSSFTITQPVSTSGSPTAFTLTGGAHTTLTASTEATDVNFNLARTVQFAAGALTTQRAFRIQAPTYSFASASTITTASTLSISGAPAAGTNATITNAYALNIESGICNFAPKTSASYDGARTIAEFRYSSAHTTYSRLRDYSGVTSLVAYNGDSGIHFWYTGGSPGRVTIGAMGPDSSLGTLAVIAPGVSGTAAAFAIYNGYTAIGFRIMDDGAISNPTSQIIEQRNSTNAQTFRIYNTYTDASNYIRQSLSFTTYSSTVHAQLAAEGAGTGAVNVPFVITPRGTGAFVLGPMPDGTATGGNARGAGAVDLQTSRTLADRVASGTNAFIGGGTNNRASGSGSVAIGGENNRSTANIAISIGDYSDNSGFGGICIGVSNQCSASYGTAIGYVNATTAARAFASGGRAGADRFGMRAHATFSWDNPTGGSGPSANAGQAQYARFVAANKTTNNTPTTLFLDGSSTRLTIPSGKVFAFVAKISGIKSDGTAVAFYTRKGCIKNVGGTTSLVGTVEMIGNDIEDNGATDIAITADDANDALDIKVTGVTGETWRWVAVVEGVEIGYGT